MARKKQAQQQTVREAVMEYVAQRDAQRRLVIRLCNELPAEKIQEPRALKCMANHHALLHGLGLDPVEISQRYFMIETLQDSYRFSRELDALQQYEARAARLLRQYDFR